MKTIKLTKDQVKTLKDILSIEMEDVKDFIHNADDIREIRDSADYCTKLEELMEKL